MIERSAILDVVVDGVVRTALVFAVYLLFSGHNAPGGGFIGGLVVGISLVLVYLASGEEGTARVVRAAPPVLLGAGLGLAVLTGAGGWVWGSALLESHLWTLEVPLLGAVKIPSAMVFDIGVFAVVIGLAGALVAALGGEDGEVAT